MNPIARCAPRRPPATLPPISANSSAIHNAISHQLLQTTKRSPTPTTTNSLESVKLPIAQPHGLPDQEESEMREEEGAGPPLVHAERKGRVQRQEHEPQKQWSPAAA